MKMRWVHSLILIVLLLGLNQCGQKGGLERPQAERFAASISLTS